MPTGQLMWQARAEVLVTQPEVLVTQLPNMRSFVLVTMGSRAEVLVAKPANTYPAGDMVRRGSRDLSRGEKRSA